jgi:hypothetical protein
MHTFLRQGLLFVSLSAEHSEYLFVKILQKCRAGCVTIRDAYLLLQNLVISTKLYAGLKSTRKVVLEFAQYIRGVVIVLTYSIADTLYIMSRICRVALFHWQDPQLHNGEYCIISPRSRAPC